MDGMAKSDHSREFRTRRSRMWRAAIPYIVLASVGGLCALAMGTTGAESSRSAWMGMLGSILALVAGLAGIVITVGRFIKCPNCGRVPTDEGAVDLSAKKCPYCDTKLS